MNISLVDTLLHNVSQKDRVFMARQLAVLLDSGVQISDALSLIGRQVTNKTVSESLMVVSKDLENGYSFSDAIKKHPIVFPKLFVNVVAAGESSGHLDVSLNMLADELERDASFRSRVVGAMLYPAFIVAAMIVVGIIMVTRIVPSLESVFKESNVALPWTTQTVMFITNSLINYWYVYVAVIVIVGGYLYRLFSSDNGRRQFGFFILRVPVIGKLFINMDMTRFSRILAMLTKSGVPIIRALDNVADVLDNAVYRDIIKDVSANVEKGVTISHVLSKYPAFPLVITQMIGVGEKTGKLEEVLNKMADYYETEVDQSIKNITSLIEPAVFVVVGLGVAFLVFSIIVPIYNLSSAIK